MNFYIKIFVLLLIFVIIYLFKLNYDKNKLFEKANKIHNNIITLDTHCDINLKNFTDSINYSQNSFLRAFFIMRDVRLLILGNN